MNVFLSSPGAAFSFTKLDRQRLGKQRVELKQILIALETGGAWSRHPATLMWRGHIGYVARMGATCCGVWLERGYKDSLMPYFHSKMVEHATTNTTPRWLSDAAWRGDCDFFEDVRANLVRKLPAHYAGFWPGTQPATGYRWPTPEH
jgi:hypothetical protein